MELLYLPFQVFLIFPPLAFIVAGVFLALFLNIKKRLKSLNFLLLFTFIVWFLYGLWELYLQYWSKTAAAPIRVDLLLIVPVLYIISGLSIIYYFKLMKSAAI